MNTDAQHTDSHDHVGHVVPLWILIGIAGILMVLTWLTLEVTKYDFGPSMNLLIAMLIAFVKATLVALFFMHLWWDRPINGVVFLSALFFVSIFVLFALLDKGEYKPNVDAYWAANAPAKNVENWETVKARAAAEKAADSESAEESHSEAKPVTPEESAEATESEPADPEAAGLEAASAPAGEQ